MTVDSFGRRSTGSSSYNDVVSQLSAPVNNVIRVDDPQSTSKKERVSSIVNEVAASKKENIVSQINQAVQWIEKLLDFNKNFGKNNNSKVDSSYLSKIAEATESLYKASQSQNTLWVGICHINNAAQKQLAKAISMSDCCSSVSRAMKSRAKFGGDVKDLSSAASNAYSKSASKAATNAVATIAVNGAGGGGGGGGGSGGGSASGGSGMNPLHISEMSASMKALSIGGMAVLGIVTSISNVMVASMDLDVYRHIFEGALSESQKFRQELRLIMHQQEGFTASNRQMEESYRQITSSVEASGVRRGEFQKLYLENLRRGFTLESKIDKSRQKSVNEIMSVTTAAANTAQSLGMSVDATNLMFMDWHQHLALSANDLAEMGRHMQSIARNTGVTGKELEKAMNSAAQIAKSLQNAGLASVQALKIANQVSAISQKHGVADQISELTKALSGDYLKSNDAIKAMLNRAAINAGIDMESVMSGSVSQDPKQMRAMFAGMEADWKDFVVGVAGKAFQKIGGDLSELGDLNKLNANIQRMSLSNDPEVKRAIIALQQLSKGRTGMELGQVQGASRTLRENKMTQGERTNELLEKMKQMENKNLQNLDEYKQLQKQAIESVTNAQLGAFTDIQGKMKDAGVSSFDKLGEDAMNSLKNNLTESMGADKANQFLSNMSGAAANLLNGLSDRAKAVNIDINSEIKKANFSGIEEIKKALSEGNIDERERALKSLNEITQKIQQGERTSQDPVIGFKEILRKMNNRLGGFLNDLMAPIGKTFVAMLAVLSSIGGLLASIWGVVSMFRIGSNLFKLLNSVAGGATTAASGATTAAGGAAGGAASGAATIAGFSIAEIAGAIAAPLLIAIGGIKGYMEADGAKKSKEEGTIMGMLTGSAGTGSMFSEMLGIDKGSTGDKALGVAGSAAYGLAIGAALAPFTAGWSLLIAPMITVGMEFIKIFTEGTNVIQKYLVDPIMMMIQPLWDLTKGIAKIAYGIVTLDGDKIWDGLKQSMWAIFDYFVAMPGKLMQRFSEGVLNLLLNIPSFLYEKITKIFFDLPKLLWGKINQELEHLANNEYVGDIFKPILELWGTIGTTFGEVYDTIVPVLSAFGDVWKEIRSSVLEALAPLFDVNGQSAIFGKVLKYLGEFIKVNASIIGFFIKFALTPLVAGIKFAGTVFRQVSKVVSKVVYGINDIFSSLSNRFSGNSIISNIFKGIFDIFVNLPMVILNGLIGLGSKMISLIGNWLLKIPKMVWEAISDLGEWLYDGLIEATKTFGSWLWDNITGGLKGIGSWLWDVITSAFGGIYSAFNEKYQGDEESKLKNDKKIIFDPSASHAIGNTAGGVKDVLSGDINNGANRMLDGVKELFMKTVDTFANLVNPINPLSWSVGSTGLDQGGLALVHKGEAIIPSDKWEQVNSSIADGPSFKEGGGYSVIDDIINMFNSSGNESDIGSMLAASLGNFVSMSRKIISNYKNEGVFSADIAKEAVGEGFDNQLNLSGVNNQIDSKEIEVHDPILLEALEKSFKERFSINNSYATTSLEGAFDQRSANDAINVAKESLVNNSVLENMSYNGGSIIDRVFDKIVEDSNNKSKSSDIIDLVKSAFGISKSNTGSSSMLLYGLFDGTNASTALGDSITEMVGRWVDGSENSNLKNSLENKKPTSRQSILAELSRALDYESSASESATQVIGSSFNKNVELGEVNTNSLDYTEDLRGEASTLGVSRAVVESTLEKERASNLTSNSMLIPSMDSISDYLVNVQSDKLDQMIDLLSNIDVKIGKSRSTSEIIGAIGGGVSPIQRPGVKSIARDNTRGFWDLAFADSSTGSITTEGRGGSA